MGHECTATCRAHTHARAVDAHNMGETSVVRDSLRGLRSGRASPLFAGGHRCCACKPFSWLRGIYRQWCWCRRHSEYGRTRPRVCMCAENRPSCVCVMHIRGQHTDARIKHAPARACECMCVCAHTHVHAHILQRMHIHARVYVHTCMHTTNAYKLKRVHLCTRAQVGMLTGAVAGLVAGRMQLGRDSQQSSACLLFLTSLPGFPLYTFCEHDQHALTVDTFFSPWAWCNAHERSSDGGDKRSGRG